MVIIEKLMLPLHLNYCWPLLSEMDGAVFSCYTFATFLLHFYLILLHFTKSIKIWKTPEMPYL